MTQHCVSSGGTPHTLVDMETTKTLGNYVKEQREKRGKTLTALAADAGLSKSELSALERNRISLPGADKRRRLARALGVSHIRLLVEAGELSEEDVRDSGLVAVPLVEPDRARLLDKLERVRLNDDRVIGLEGPLDRWLRFDRDAENPVKDYVVGGGDHGGIAGDGGGTPD